MKKNKPTITINISRLIDKVEIVTSPSLEKKERRSIESSYLQKVQVLEESVSRGILRSIELASRL